MNLNLETYRPDERYVYRSAPDQREIVRMVGDQEIGWITLIGLSSPGVAGVRLSPRGDIPFSVVETVRRMVSESVEEVIGGTVKGIISRVET